MIECLLGLYLPHRDQEFDLAVVGDLVRMLPQDLVARHLREMARVARRVQLVLSCGRGHEERYRVVSGWSWSRPDQVTEIARSIGLQICSRTSGAQTTQIVIERPTG
jgi:hypothetical protein